MRNAAGVMPDFFSSTNVSKFKTSLAVYDENLYFWLKEDDRDFIGRIPLPNRKTPIEEDIVIWVVPKEGCKTEFCEKWSKVKHSVENTDWIKDIVKSEFIIEAQEINITKDEKGTKALSHFPVNNHYQNAKELQRQHALEIMTTDNLLQIKVSFLILNGK